MEKLRFDNRFTRLLPADTETENYRRQVYRACYSYVQPTPVVSPTHIAYAPDVASLLGLSRDDCMAELFAHVFSGNRLLPGMQPHATCYGGHQFGSWAGQLGDGRAINLGETVNEAGEHWMLQLKGAGPTPYSRSADGLAVLRSSIREFLCSEAMYHLGVPTTRALSLVATGEQVMRDMFYDGHPALEPGAVVCRVAPSFARFGSLQIFALRKDTATLKTLLDYIISYDFPHLGVPEQPCYLRWFEEVCRRTAELMVQWMRVGFVHGVMNTDNMSLLGLTIDYGPYGWLDVFDPEWTPNTTDRETHRYAFGRQPDMAGWNLARLGEAILPLIGDALPVQEILDQYAGHYRTRWQSMMADKLGLSCFNRSEDVALMESLQRVLQVTETDMTIFYRRLADIDVTCRPDAVSDALLLQPLQGAFYRPEELAGDAGQQIASWLRRYIHRLQQDGRSQDERRACMHRCNPKYVLRNYLAQVAIERAEAGDFSEIHRLQLLLARPYDEQPEWESYAVRRPEWARERAGCSMLSCSS